MKTTTKILTVVLIIIILVATGAAAYIYVQNTKTSTQSNPTPTPSPTPIINATETTSGQTYGVGLSGNVTVSQISNVTITPDQAATLTTVSFNITGQSGTTGFSNMTIPKTSIVYGTTPAVYIDGQQAQDQGYTEDATNFYVWYTTHFSTHQIVITFTSSQTASPTPSSTSTPTAIPTPTPSPSPTPTHSPTTLTVATTTSLHDTGLEDNGTGNIKAAFQAQYPWITVNFVALGTGDAIKKAQAGDADMILVHSPSQEVSFLTGGYGVDRKIVAFNFFVIVGPANDPAGISGMTNVNQALVKLYTAAQTNSQVIWVTRNDGSGTATAESNLWKAAGYTYAQLITNTTWFKSTGSGMGASLQVADQLNGYILSDMGTYLAYSSPSSIQPIQLKIEIQAQQALLNVYSAIIDNPQNANLTGTNFNAAMTFVNYLVSDVGQQLIANYGVSTYNQPLFNPFVPLVSGTAPNATLLSWIQSYAYINSTNQINANGTECPQLYRYNAGNLYAPSYDALANMNLSPSISIENYYSTDSQQLMLAQPSTYSQSGGKLNKE
jgi:tungstate transport system substrate-binding protein